MRRLFQKIAFCLRARLAGRSRVSPSVYLKGAERVRLGGRCKVHGGVVLDASRGGRVEIGDRVTLNRQVSIQASTGSVRIDTGAEINSQSFIDGTGGVSIGADTLLGPGVRIISYQHGIEPGSLIRDQASTPIPIAIGRDVWIGANAVVLANVGDGAVIGAGAVVTRDVPAGEVWVGVPARFLRTR